MSREQKCDGSPGFSARVSSDLFKGSLYDYLSSEKRYNETKSGINTHSAQT